MAHLVLLGDSVFDNALYTGDEPSVTAHLATRLGDAHEVTLCAVDGSVSQDVVDQLERIPADATHLAVSSGGNDALRNIGLLQSPATSVSEVLAMLDEPVRAFAAAFAVLVDGLAQRNLPTAVCTIYEGDLEPALVVPARVAVALFNDVIYRLATARRIPVIELRDVCTEPDDYANPIEPSGQGGMKIARAVATALGLH